jgi:hypothetical protein
LISDAKGLQPRDVAVPLALTEGGVRSLVHVTVLDAVAVLPQPSIAVKVLVCERLQVVLLIAPSLCVTVTVLQPSLALADPNAKLISVAAGLQPKLKVVPFAVIKGDVGSAVQVAVRDTDDVLPHASVAMNVLVCDREQLVLDTVPSVCVIVGDPHASVAVALPSAALIAVDVGLHPRVVLP